MIDVDIARRLRDLGLPWEPADGDRFVIDAEEMQDQVFMLSSMVVEHATGRHGLPVFRFNGTTEWALDSIEQHEAVWIPREDQLRAALGEAFVALRREVRAAGGSPGGSRPAGESAEGAAGAASPAALHVVTVNLPAGPRDISAPLAEDALAGALLVLLQER